MAWMTKHTQVTHIHFAFRAFLAGDDVVYLGTDAVLFLAQALCLTLLTDVPIPT